MERLASIPRTARPAREAAGRWAKAARAALDEHRVYLAIIAVYAVGGWLAAWLAGGLAVFHVDALSSEFGLLVAAFAVGSAIIHALWAMVRVGPGESLLGFVARGYAGLLADPRHITRFVVAIAPLPLFLSVFSSLKRAIPYFVPYDWDPAFMAWDRWLHFGRHPWELLMPVLGSGFATTAVNVIYNAWFFVVLFTLMWIAQRRRDPALRMRFLLTFLVSWILMGSVLAPLLASGGPVYFGRLTGEADPFAPLMAHLQMLANDWPVWSLAVQEHLWDNHVARGTMLGGGISAMPSMHVAMAVLLALTGWRISRAAGIAFTLFASAILLGSIHLGWHYAVDGYAAMVLVPLIWWACGQVVLRQEMSSRETRVS